jgi:hypothetical protein
MLFGVQPVWAASVLLVRPAVPNAVTAEALVRVQGELRSNGFSIQFDAAENVSELDKVLATVARDRGVDAVLAILGAAAPESIVVWVSDLTTGRSLRRETTFTVQGDRSAEVLAIRAMEFLRASLLEVRLGVGELPPRPAPTPPQAEVVRAPAPPGASAPALPWGFEVGGAMIASFDGVGPALLPLFRVDHAFASWAVARLSLAGLGSRARVEGAGESADVTQQIAMLGGVVRLRHGQRVRPVLTLGGGLLRTVADGRADWPYLGRSMQRWSLLVALGTGVWLKLGGRYDVAVELHAAFAQPYPVVTFVSSQSASLGHPDILLTLTLLGWL